MDNSMDNTKQTETNQEPQDGGAQATEMETVCVYCGEIHYEIKKVDNED